MIIKATSPTVSPLGTGFKFIVYMQVYAAKRFLDKKIYTQLFVVVKLRRLEPFSFVYQDLLFNAIPFLNHLNLLEERFKSLNNLLGTSDMPPGKSPFAGGPTVVANTPLLRIVNSTSGSSATSSGSRAEVTATGGFITTGLLSTTPPGGKIVLKARNMSSSV